MIAEALTVEVKANHRHTLGEAGEVSMAGGVVSVPAVQV